MIMHHICIQTDTYNESKSFYRDILGFEVVEETPNFHNRDYNTWLKIGDFMIELQTNKKDESLAEFNKSSRGIVHFCMYVENLEEEYNRIKKLGFTNFKSKNNSDIYDVNGGKLLKMIAPEGTIIELRDSMGI